MEMFRPPSDMYDYTCINQTYNFLNMKQAFSSQIINFALFFHLFLLQDSRKLHIVYLVEISVKNVR